MGKKILVIDDDKAIRSAFTLALDGEPYEVETAASGEDGVIAFERSRPQLVFLDLKMPGLNGVQTLKKIRKIDPDTPVYIVTAFAKEFLDELNEALAAGLEFEVFNKPVSADQIVDLARQVLK